ncbi:MAG: tetratricopeptide repeat protein [Pseudomonadota bacterium]
MARSIDKLQTAATHYQAGRIDEAEKALHAALKIEPTMVDGLHLQALIHRQRGLLDDAAKVFRRCLKLAPERADIHANHGNLLRAQGKVEEAIGEYETALQHDSGFRPARLALAQTLNSQRRHAEAAQHARRVIRDNADDAQAWVALGQSERGLDNPESAEAAYRQAIQLQPGYGTAHHDLGALLASQSRHEEAHDSLFVAMQSGVQGPEIAYNLATTLAGLNQFAQAEDLLNKATEAFPEGVELHRLLARLRYMRGEEAFDGVIRSAVNKRPDYAPLVIAHAQLLRAAERFDEALDALKTLSNDSEHRRAIDAEVSGICQDAGRYDEALAAAEQVAGDNEGYGAHVDLLIDPLMCLGRADQAMPWIELARQSAPLNQWYIAMEATAARLLGDERYEQLYDYERFVQPYAVEAPEGWSSTEEFRRDLNAALIARHQFNAQPLDQSLRNGTQTPRGMLGDPDPVIQGFLKAILEPIQAYRQHIGAADDHPMTARNHGELRMTGCWSVRLHRDGFHVNHVHSEGWMSSAYYAEVPDEVDDGTHSGWIQFGEPRFPVPGATPAKFVKPEPGTLVLFPSSMWHGTLPLTGDSARMTIAFDAICRTDGGNAPS